MSRSNPRPLPFEVARQSPTHDIDRQRPSRHGREPDDRLWHGEPVEWRSEDARKSRLSLAEPALSLRVGECPFGFHEARSAKRCKGMSHRLTTPRDIAWIILGCRQMSWSASGRLWLCQPFCA